MTSIGSYTKQVPLNNGYFRAIPGLNGTAHPSTFLFTVNTAGAVSSWAVPTGFTATFAATLSSAFLKDMGTQVVSSGRTFRRVQVVVANLSSTDGVAGVTTPVGTDSDFLCAYIETGFRGNLAPGPFVRTG